MLEAPEHQNMNGKFEVTWRTLSTIANSLMVHVRFLEAYIHFALMYLADHIFRVIPIKDLINENGNPTTPYKLATCTKPSLSHLRVLFFPYVVRKATARVGTKVLNMRHQEHNGFRSIFIGIPQHKKQYLVYVPHIEKIISLYDIVFMIFL